MSDASPAIQVYGAGRVGLAILNLARMRGVPLTGAWNPRELRPERRALLPGIPLTISPQPPAVAADLWLVAVPDDAIADVAQRLARAPGPRPSVAAHCAGAIPGALLAPLADLGVACGSFHPAMTFRGADGDAEALAGAVVAIEGEPRAVELLEHLADRLGVARVAVAAENKARYHTALVLASNGRMALDAAAVRLLQEAGLDEGDALALLRPLTARTEENLRFATPAHAHTGPVARGDARTVRSQLDALADRPRLLALYRALGTFLLDLVPAGVRGPGHREVERLLVDERRKDGREPS
ncbi:MAG TPA: Rossmann-like and DUF2520 domain-containing protein [Gemmatimonadota bacterium]|nr:Rossmann-like and DUF2520 domain-containing protein [Gemmatimonadota bacterium]